MPVSAFIFMTSLFAETNRQPFDMPESEADLVGGFHTEYGAFKWGLFFVAEYSHMTIGSGVFTLLFLGGWNPLPWLPLADLIGWAHHVFGSNFWIHPLTVGVISIGIFLLKVILLIFFFMWVRWTVPRFRYDQVMEIGWKKLLPLAIWNLSFYTFEIGAIQLNQPAWVHAVIVVGHLAFLAISLSRVPSTRFSIAVSPRFARYLWTGIPPARHPPGVASREPSTRSA